jgi:hypothetical protein
MFSLLFFSGVDVKALFEIGYKQTLYSMIFILPIYFAARSLGRRAMNS